MIKFQLKGSKVGNTTCHLSTNKSTCIQECEYCYNDPILLRWKNVGKNYDNVTQSIINREKIPPIPKNKVNCRISINGDFSFDNIDDSIYYIMEWYRVASEHENVNFFSYTKSWKDKKLLPYLNKLRSLKNVTIRASIDKTTGYKIPKNWTYSGILENNTLDKIKVKKYFICQFNNKKSKLYKVPCDKCKICISKKLSHIPVFFDEH